MFGVFHVRFLRQHYPDQVQGFGRISRLSTAFAGTPYVLNTAKLYQYEKESQLTLHII